MTTKFNLARQNERDRVPGSCNGLWCVICNRYIDRVPRDRVQWGVCAKCSEHPRHFTEDQLNKLRR